MNELNKLAVTEGKKRVLIYDKASGEIIRNIDPKFADQPGTIETYITNDQIIDLTRNDIMDMLNLNRGKSGIPVKEFSRYIPDDNTSSNFDLDVRVDTDVIKTDVDSSYGDSSQKIKSDPKKQVVGTSEEEKTKALLRKVKNIKPEEFKKITGKDLDQQTKDDMRDFIQEKGLDFMSKERKDEISKIIKKLNRNKL